MKSAVGSLAVVSLFGRSRGWSRQINDLVLDEKYQSSTVGWIVRSVHLMFGVRRVNGEAWLVNAVDHFHPGGGGGCS